MSLCVKCDLVYNERGCLGGLCPLCGGVTGAEETAPSKNPNVKVVDAIETCAKCGRRSCSLFQCECPSPAPEPTTDRVFESGAVRTNDADTLDFASLPLLALFGLAQNGGVGGMKYGRFNYAQGMPAHECCNHAAAHLLMFLAGDRSEPHLIRAAWNCLAAEQSMLTHPELNAPHLPGPGFTITPEVKAHMEAGSADRAEKRKAGFFDKLEGWTTATIPRVARLLGHRRHQAAQGVIK